MTSGGLARATATQDRVNPESLVRGLAHISRLFRPGDGWLALILLALNLVVVVRSVEQAEWVPTPDLRLVLLLGMVTAVVLARVPLWAPLVLPVGLGIGLLVVVWQLTTFQAGTPMAADAAELWDRLRLWFEAAKAGSINIDQVPFSFGLTTATWIMGYLGVWLFSRHRNFWGVFILGGAGLLSNLTYLPPNASTHLGLFMFTALLLVARVQSVRRRQRWQRRNIQFDGHLGLLSVSDSFILATAVLFVAFVLIPTGPRLGLANDAYDLLRSPMKGWEDDFNRLFAGLPARRPLGYRIWGDVMAFQGTINPTTAQVLRVESTAPMYWKARTYGTYTSKGWVSQDTTLESFGWAPSYTSPQAASDRIEVSYSVTPNYAAKSLFAGDQAVAVDREVRVETYDSPTYTLDLTDQEALRALPSPLADAAANLQRIIDRRGAGTEDSALADGLPPGLRLLGVSRSQGIVREATIAEALPPQPDVLSLRTVSGRIRAGDTYQITSALSQATPRDLREAGTDYPTWALVKYTQLPDDLPQPVRDLAAELTDGAETPYDMAEAIRGYLRNFPYTLKVDPPPFNSDGVEHFLFTLQEGYSEYFASSMTVLLRSSGVPARLATGYTMGDKLTDQDLYVVTDSHSHAWVEVFFPRHGWIAFEPTPGKALPPAYSPEAEELPDEFSGAFDGSLIEELCDEEIDICDEEDDFSSSGFPFESSTGLKERLVSMAPWLIAAVSLTLVLAGAIWLFWRRYMVPSADPRTAYRRLGLLGALGSVGPAVYQTPFQYRERLHAVLPDHGEEVSSLINAYVRNRYGAKELATEERQRLVDAWMGVRLPLLWRIFRRRDS